MVFTGIIEVHTRGECDVVDITSLVAAELGKAGIASGLLGVFVSGSTAGITTIEYEPGVLDDLKQAFERIAPRDFVYQHDRAWGDGNGFSHVRALLLGASLTVPFSQGELQLGTWQQIVLVDFDNRPRSRRVIVQVVGD